MENQFLIVGQGIAGSLLAYNLYKSGRSFKILSNSVHPLPTVNSMRKYNPFVYNQMAKSWMIDEVLPVMLNLYRDLEKELGQKFLYPLDRNEYENEMNVWNERIFDGDFSRYRENHGKSWLQRSISQFSWFDKEGKAGYLDLTKLLFELKELFKTNGNLIESDFQYKDIGFINGSITWQGNMADSIVFCEGYRAAHNPFFKEVPFTPVKGEVMEIEAFDLPEKYIVQDHIFILPIGNHRFKVGITHRYNSESISNMIQDESELLAAIQQIVSVPYKMISQWRGVRSFISDGKPVLGVHPYNKKLAIFNGLGSKGAILAPYFAREMCYSLVHRNYILPKEIDVRRFCNV